MRKNIQKSKRAQVETYTIVLVFGIILALVITSYIWGRGLMETQKTRTMLSYMQIKLLDLKGNIIEVSHEGVNSSRAIQVDVSEGYLSISSGDHCSGTSINSNGIVFNISSKSKLVDAENWALIDPREDNESCTASYINNSAGILVAKNQKVATTYVNSFMIWFRKLTDESNIGYLINISAKDTTVVSGGTYTVVVRNVGFVNSSNTIYSNVQIDIV